MIRRQFSYVFAVALIALGYGVVGPVSAEPPEANREYAAVLTVKRMCCAKESVPAIKELTKIPGVKRVGVDYKKRCLLIERDNTDPSPRELWEAAERVKIAPVRLATPSNVYTSRPRR